MSRNTLLAWAVLAAAILFAVVPFFTPFDGFDPERFPIPQREPPVQPAGWAFSIWSVIYLWLIASAAYGVWRRPDDPAWAPARPWLLASLAVGVPWLPVAGVSPIAALVMIWVMCLTALAALARSPAEDRLWFRAPVGLYAGWLTAASWVSVALNGAGFGIVAGEFAWAVVAILCALAMAHMVLTRIARIPEFALAVIWALIAIAVKTAEDHLILTILASVGAIDLAIMAVRNWQSRAAAPA